jgi:hypothetical protein
MRRMPLFVSLILALVVAGSAAPVRGITAAQIPDKFTDQYFWRLSDELSEPNGSFRSENMISNEMVLWKLIPEVVAKTKPGGVYLGVGPEQNFSYIAIMKPKIAFITDIRRGNLHVLMMYKALFELSASRAEFIARLFVKPKLAGITTSSSARDLMDAVWAADTLDEAAFTASLDSVNRLLTKTHSIPLSAEDLDGIARAYRTFYWYGPAINYSASTDLRNLTGGRSATYWDLMTQADADGKGLSYLSSEEKFRFLKDMFARNMIVPLVGNFSGPKTIRAIGAWVRERGATVSAFYVSSVENYLRRDGSMATFCESVATLPVDANSIFIRPGNAGGLPGGGTFTIVVPPTGGAPERLLPVQPAGQAIGSYNNGVVVPITGNCQ